MRFDALLQLWSGIWSFYQITFQWLSDSVLKKTSELCKDWLFASLCLFCMILPLRPVQSANCMGPMGPMGPTKVRGLATGSEFSSTQVTQPALQPALMALMIFMGESGCAGCACRSFVYSTYYKYLQIWTAKVTSRTLGGCAKVEMPSNSGGYVCT